MTLSSHPVLPAGPELAVEQQTMRWFAQPCAFMRTCFEQLGEPFTLHLSGTGPHVFFSHPDALRQIFTAPWQHLHAGVGNAVWLSALGPDSLLLLDGDAHLQARRQVQPALLMQHMRHYADIIRAVTDRVSSAWTVGTVFPMMPSMLEISLEVIVRAIFGLDEGAQLDEFKARCAGLVETANFRTRTATQPASAADARFDRRLAPLDALIYEAIRERRSHPEIERHDILTHLMAADTMRDGALRDQVITLMLAGHETTASSLAWAMHWILSDSNVLERIRETLARQCGTPRSMADDEPRCPVSAGPMDYLDAVCRETLRISPTIPIVSRYLRAPTEIAGHLLPADVSVVAAIYLTHHRADVYPQPDRFMPQRFLERRYSPYEFLPFGGGVRRCVGMDFAIFEMKAVLAHILSRFDLTLVSPDVKPVRRTVTVTPSGGTRVRLMGRRKSP